MLTGTSDETLSIIIEKGVMRSNSISTPIITSIISSALQNIASIQEISASQLSINQNELELNANFGVNLKNGLINYETYVLTLLVSTYKVCILIVNPTAELGEDLYASINTGAFNISVKASSNTTKNIPLALIIINDGLVPILSQNDTRLVCFPFHTNSFTH
jgi:hypothetical protein